MNYPIEQERIRIQSNVDHYNRSSRLRAYCCGCIYTESNSILICFLWALISFYFAVLAFMQKSPFYSYVQDVPLVVFGAVNLLFGIVSLCSIAIFLIRMGMIRRMQLDPGMLYNMTRSRNTVFAITACALGVLAVTLVNFVLFVIAKDKFINEWCIGSSASYYLDTVSITSNSTIAGALGSRDMYNCERLFENEAKWSLLCLICMFVVYIHWILIIAAKYNFYAPLPVVSLAEYGNMAPSEKTKDENEKRGKSAKDLWREFLTHKQYDEFVSIEDQNLLNIRPRKQITDMAKVDSQVTVPNQVLAH